MRFGMPAAGIFAGWLIAVACVPCAFAEGAAKATDPAKLCATQGDSNPTPVERPPVRYPMDQVEQNGDGSVSLMLTVAEDGAVRDLVVLDSVGAPSFRKAATDAVRLWRYRPVLRNGKPAVRYGVPVEVDFTTRGPNDRGSSAAFIALVAHLKTAKLSSAEQHALFLAAEPWPLGFRDRTILAWGLALGERELGNWRNALYHIRHARPVDLAKADIIRKEGTFGENDIDMAGAVLRMRAQLEAHDGHLREAVCLVERVKAARVHNQDDDPGVKAAADALARLNDPAPLAVSGLIFKQPESDLPPAWIHGLSRPTFSFAETKGAVKSFRLVCPDAIVEQDVALGPTWTAPGDPRACRLFVFGDAGASFKFVETW